jgi:hypothetical protein
MKSTDQWSWFVEAAPRVKLVEVLPQSRGTVRDPGDQPHESARCNRGRVAGVMATPISAAFSRLQLGGFQLIWLGMPVVLHGSRTPAVIEPG